MEEATVKRREEEGMTITNMEPEMNDSELTGKLAERFKSLPKPVQDAINSASVEGHLRSLATTHKLHLDQWQLLENQVMLTLLGFQDPKELKQNIQNEIVVTDEVATAIAADISKVVFEPIRQELERELDHPAAQMQTQTGVEQVTAQALAGEATPASAATAIPITPPAPLSPVPAPPDTKAIRAPISEVYKPGETSTARKDVVNDPYRESPK
jgi:hypothetical protein